MLDGSNLMNTLSLHERDRENIQNTHTKLRGTHIHSMKLYLINCRIRTQDNEAHTLTHTHPPILCDCIVLNLYRPCFSKYK